MWLAPSMMCSSLGSFAFSMASWLMWSVSATEPAISSSGRGEISSIPSNGKNAICWLRLERANAPMNRGLGSISE